MKLPLWFALITAPDKVDSRTIERIAEALSEGKDVIIKLNSKPTRIKYYGKDIFIEEIKDYIYDICL